MSRMWRIRVQVPIDAATHEQRDALFTAIADAAHAWEPQRRDGWDVDVAAYSYEPVGDWHAPWCLAPTGGICEYCGASEAEPYDEATP